MRLDVDWDRLGEPISEAELAANYEASRGFTTSNIPSSLLLAKPLDRRPSPTR